MDEEHQTGPVGGPGPEVRPAAEAPTRPLWLEPPTTPPLAAPPEGPPRPPNPLLAPPPPPERPVRGTTGWFKPALLGAIVGALVAAAVAGGIVAATDDDGSLAAPVVSRASDRLGGEGLDVASVLAKVKSGVVAINIEGVDQGRFVSGAGSGAILDDEGYVLTNAHVVCGASAITVGLLDGREIAADLVGSSPDDDIALLRLRERDDLEPVTLGRSSQLQVGDDLVAVGNALGLGSDPTVTTGIVSALDRTIDSTEETCGVTPRLESLIQTDAAINRGNSGGPLVNANGEVIGVNTAIAASGQNIGFALSIDSVKPVIERLRAGGGQFKAGPLLGVTTRDLSSVTEDFRIRFDIEAEDGALVIQVLPGSGADEAGIEPGDVITAIDGRSVSSAADVGAIVADHEPAEELEITYERNGEQQTTRATLGSRPVESGD